MNSVASCALTHWNASWLPLFRNAKAWAKNVGWRLDYHFATPGIASKATRASIYTAKRFSDHAPLTIDYDHPH